MGLLLLFEDTPPPVLVGQKLSTDAFPGGGTYGAALSTATYGVGRWGSALTNVTEEVGTPASPAVTTLVSAAATGADQSSYTGVSIDLPDDEIVYVAILTRKNNSVIPENPAVTGCSLTWTLVDSQTFSDGGVNRYRLSVWESPGLGATAGALTFDFSGIVQASAIWHVVRVRNLDATTWRLQAVKATGTGTTPAVTLAAFGQTTNAVLAFSGAAIAAAYTAGTGYTEVAEGTDTSTEMQTQFRADSDTSVDWTLASSGTWAAIAMELKNTATGGGSIPDPPPPLSDFYTGFEDAAAEGLSFFGSGPWAGGVETTTVYQGARSWKFARTAGAQAIYRLNQTVAWPLTVDIWYGAAIHLMAGFYAATPGQTRVMAWTDYDGTTQNLRGGLYINSNNDVRIMRVVESPYEQTELIGLGNGNASLLPEATWVMVEIHQVLSGTDGLALTELYIDGALESTSTAHNIVPSLVSSAGEITRMRYGLDDSYTNAFHLFMDRCYHGPNQVGA